MDYELMVAAGLGITTGITIFLFLTVRRIVEMQRCMEGLVQELIAVRRIEMSDENDPFGATAAARSLDRPHP